MAPKNALGTNSTRLTKGNIAPFGHTSYRDGFYMAIKLVGLIFCASTICAAQQTWGGLHFGMKADEVKAALTDRINDGKPSAARDHDTYNLELKSFTVGDAQGRGYLTFKKQSDQLSAITLVFHGGFLGTGCRWDATPEQGAKIIGAIEDVSGKLLENYGTPVEERDWHDHEDITNHLVYRTDLKDSERMWRYQGQIITEWVMLPCSSLFITVSYRPAGKGDL